MKSNFLLFFLLASFGSFAGGNDTTWFNEDWSVCKRTDAAYFRLYLQENGKYYVTDYFLNGKVQMKAESSRKDSLVKNGIVVYFDSSGRKSSEGNYVDGKPVGKQIQWRDEGRDSVVFEYMENGNKFYHRNVDKDAAQNPDTGAQSKSGDKEYTFVEVMPEFPGGTEKLFKFISKNLEYPASAKKDKVQGRVYVRFIIDKTGAVRDVKIDRGIRSDVDEAALEAVRKMPNWTPGYQNGKPVQVQMRIPILFKLK